MRARAPFALALGSAFALIVAAPASAAGNTYDWSAGGSPIDEWSASANWGGLSIGSFDTLNFPTGGHAHNDLGAGYEVQGLSFSSPGFLLDGDEIRVYGGGIQASQSATTNLDLRVAESQTWSTTAGADLVHQGWVHVDGSSILTIDGSGIMEFPGRLDGGGTGSVIKTGTGILILSAGGGGAIKDGLQVDAGEVRVTGALGGTDFAVNGGRLTSGDSSSSATGIVRAVDLNSGIVSPGSTPGIISVLHAWGVFTANAGGNLDIDVNGSAADLVDVYPSAVLNGATLRLNVVTAPAVGTVLPIVTTQTGTVTGTVTSRTGATLTNGDEFTDGGHRWLLTIGQGSLSVEYLGAVPNPPAVPGLADTGATTTWLIPVGGAIVVLGIVLLLLRRFVRAKSRR